MAGVGWLLSSLLVLALLVAAQCYAFIGNLKLQLVGGSNSNEGVVQVRQYDNAPWGRICWHWFDARDAAVVCRQWDHRNTWGEYYSAGRSGPVYLSELQCHGNEANLSQCRSVAWSTSAAWWNKSWWCYLEVRIKCYQPKVRIIPQSGDFREAQYGAVQVLRTTDYRWVSVCDSDWDDNDARVICKSAGHFDGKAQCCGRLTKGSSYHTGRYWTSGSVSSISCSGTESSFDKCTYTNSNSRCPSSPGLASVICYDQPRHSVDTSFAARLATGASSNWGRVEVRHAGVWGSVCAGNSWNDSSASIACRQATQNTGGVRLGFHSGHGFRGSAWIRQLNCSGNETSLEQCVVPPWGAVGSYCQPQYALCYASSAPVVELVGDSDRSYGRVEIVMDGARYTVCDDNWEQADAFVVCRSLGYAGGQAIKGSHYGRGSGSVGLNGLQCNGNEDNILQCLNNGWLQSTAQCDSHTKDASVACHGQVMLRYGDHNNGIVQMAIDGHYRSICGSGFDDTDAGVVCKDLGFLHGRKLSTGSYGSVNTWPRWRNVGCQGNESSIFNCTHDTGHCSDHYTNYAAVHCYNGTVDTTRTVSLTGAMGDYSNSSGNIRLYQNGVTGKICSDYWDDKDAGTVCRQLGFSKGAVYRLSSPMAGPYLMSEVNCVGNESSLFNCSMGNASCSSGSQNAGAFCFSDDPPQVQLVGGSSNKAGRVEIIFGDTSGTVCITSSSSYERNQVASVVCRSLGFATGQAKSVPGGTGQVALGSVRCHGYEKNILACENSGFMAPYPGNCNSHTSDLGVTCQDEVKLIRVIEQTSDTIIGVVQLYRNYRWNYVCGTFFDDVDAGVVCQKMGYRYFKALPAGAFGRVNFRTSAVGGVNCTGSEDSLGSCPLQVGGCNNGNYLNYASVVCSRIAIPQGVQAAPPASQPGDVLVEVDGLRSRVCSNQWDNNDATVYCRDLGYNFGRKFGSVDRSSSSIPRLIYNVACSGNESNIGDCPFNFTTSSNFGCANYMTARVFCYNSPQDFQVRLVGGKGRHEGNVEIRVNGQWWSVCDHFYLWKTNDANVVCRSLGFVGGYRMGTGAYGYATSPTLIIYAECRGNEQTIAECPQRYFNDPIAARLYRCSGSPASVRCTGEVKLTPDTTYGALQMLVNSSISSYGLVCADGFGPKEATVACRDLGYPYGLQMSAGAFGYVSSPRIKRTNLKCTGREAILRECTYSDSMNYCPSRKYASVVCSKLSPNSGYSVSLETVQNYPYGRAKVQHMGNWGYVCSNGFDNNDAAVICRESGYTGGVAFKYYNYDRTQPISYIRWLTDIQCTGTEAYLARCRNVVWGNITNCSEQSAAGAFCYEHTAPHFRLVSGTSTMGRLELWSDNGRDTVCSEGWGDREAAVACNSMGFNGGRFLGAGVFGQGTGDVLLDYARCQGTESSLLNCLVVLKGYYRRVFCDNHQYDASIQCFNTTRLVGSSQSTYGRVEVLGNQTWVAVCDDGFDTNAARVACRAVGYSEARSQCCSALGPLTYNTIGAVVNHCSGNESSLLDCNITFTDTCSSGKYASALCFSDTIQEHGLQTRLVETVYGPTRTYVGGVQANQYGFWGPVCNSSWDDRDANATCHGLGYNYGISFYGRDRSEKPMVVGNFQCTGQEASLADCQYGDLDDDIGCSLPLSSHNRRDAGALCFDTPGIGLRLVGGLNNYWGRVEVQFAGEWGRVLDDSWSSEDATVVCRQLGYNGGRSPPYSMRINHPVRTAKTWMAHVRCSGNERTLFECLNYWDYQSDFVRDANVICNNNVRLTRGNYVSVGIVEVNINNKWGSICDDHWSDRNTQLTCQSLGFDNGYRVCCGAFGKTYFPLMALVSCTGSDRNLTSCSHQIPDNYRCTGDVVAVACYKGSPPTAYNYSLSASPENNNIGQISIDFMNMTGHICSDGWDDNDAKVFCSELGYEYGQAYEHNLFNSYYSNTGLFWTTNVNCQGTESRLGDCQFTVGTVSNCQSRKAAGVSCTDIEGIFYRLGGSDSEFKGRVEVAVNGQWGSVCPSRFGSDEASVFCRGQGFNEGTVDYSSGSYPNAPSRIYRNYIRCKGHENRLNDCAHTGWKVTSYCTHDSDVKVICYNDVRIGRAYNPSIRQGPVQFYRNGTWYNLCDAGFDDVTAKRVCQDLDFVDGKAVVGSAYGSTSHYDTPANFTMHCQGNKQSSAQCINQDNNCTSGTYASVVCFTANDFVDESTYSFDFVDSSKRSGAVAVTHMNVTGRVCNNDWDDNDARVLCKTKGHLDGIAFRYSKHNYASSSRGPFWVSSMNCTGKETDLKDCPFKDRLHLGDCSKSDLAGALCFNDSGIQYRISSDGPKPSEGRVEISVGGVWGTVCRRYWDERDSTVFCRSQGYTEGYSIQNTFGTTGSGPVWLSGLRCTGTESALHQCPHSGFSDTPVEDGHYYYGCSSHHSDAYVSCVDTLKLNLGYKASMGAVMVYRHNTWNLICDNGFDHADALVVCRQQGYQFATFLQGSMFGNVDANITISTVHCRGTEGDFSACDFEDSSTCQSQNYASVVCSNDPIYEESQNVRLVRDDPNEPRHGYLEYQMNGVWGAVCADTLDTNSVSVACKQLGFTGGQLYRPNYGKYQTPILTTDLKCKGTETRLDACPRATVPASAWCDFHAARAGVLCYNDTAGISYRLAGDESDATRGRFEMKYMGQYGFACTFYDNNHAARVACKSVGFKDGLGIGGTRYLPAASEPVWFYGLFCNGKEKTIPQCQSSGFNMTEWYHRYSYRACRNSYGPFSVQCYQNELAITDVRIVDGDTNSSGRVEVFLSGPDRWGTVCDDLWNDVDATVVCNQLGFATGKAVGRARFGQGRGNIWMDHVGCKGTETRLQDCGFSGYNIHHCRHFEDAGVICEGVYVPPVEPGQTTPSSSEPNKQGQAAGDDSSNTAAIVVPIFVILAILGLAGGLGFFMYRRRQNNNSLELLEDSGSSPPGQVSFSQGGVVRFMNRIRGRGKEDTGLELPGISNPGYDQCQGISNHGNKSIVGVFAADHVDFTDA